MNRNPSTAVQMITPIGMATPGGHYSHATVANGFIFVSGQLPITPQGVKLVDASFEEQAMQALANVQAVLEAAEGNMKHLVQVRVYLDSVVNWPKFNNVYALWAGSLRPARVVVPTGPLHFGLKVEVEAVGLVSPIAGG